MCEEFGEFPSCGVAICTQLLTFKKLQKLLVCFLFFFSAYKRCFCGHIWALCRSNLPYSCGPNCNNCCREATKNTPNTGAGMLPLLVGSCKGAMKEVVLGTRFPFHQILGRKSVQQSYVPRDIEWTDSWIPDMVDIITLTVQERWFQDRIHQSRSFLGSWNVGSVSSWLGFCFKSLTFGWFIYFKKRRNPTWIWCLGWLIHSSSMKISNLPPARYVELRGTTYSSSFSNYPHHVVSRSS